MKRELVALERLEDRTFFSVVTPDGDAMTTSSASALLDSLGAVHATSAIMTASTVKKIHPLQAAFNVAGTFTHDVSPGGNPDVGHPYVFTGTGNTPKLGNFDLTGWVQPPGFIANAESHGKLWLTNPQGSLSLIVTGPPQEAGVLPPSLTFVIKAGHGAYVHSRGSGQIIVAASDTTQKFVFKFNQAS